MDHDLASRAKIVIWIENAALVLVQIVPALFELEAASFGKALQRRSRILDGA